MAGEKKTRRKHKRIPVSQEQLRKTQAIVDANLKDNPDMFKLPASKHSVEPLTDYFVKTKADTTRILYYRKKSVAMLFTVVNPLTTKVSKSAPSTTKKKSV